MKDWKSLLDGSNALLLAHPMPGSSATAEAFCKRLGGTQVSHWIHDASHLSTVYLNHLTTAILFLAKRDEADLLRHGWGEHGGPQSLSVAPRQEVRQLDDIGNRLFIAGGEGWCHRQHAGPPPRHQDGQPQPLQAQTVQQCQQLQHGKTRK